MVTGIGAPVRRVEDPPLVTGSAHYTDDLPVPGALHAAFVRSVMAHARIGVTDTAEAAAMPGVVAALTAADLDLPLLPPGLGPAGFARPPLAGEVVRFMGEAVAVVVAATREQALDAVEAVQVDYEPLPVVTDPVAALEPGAPVLFPAHGSNLAVEQPWEGERARVDECEVVLRARLVNQRLVPAPMEPGTALAAPDADTGGITLWAPCQAPFWTRAAVAGALGLDPSRVRVVAPAVGGAFGARIVTYPEQVVVAALARRLGRPVRYVESRSETMLTMTHGRGQLQQVELGATREGVITDLKVRIIADGGAYPGDASLMPGMTVRMLCGPYRIRRVEAHASTVATNSTPVAAYRGAGRPEATWLLERMVDLLAARLGLDPAEVRRRNLIQPDAFPYDTVAGARYDSGDYPAALERVLQRAGYERLRAEQAERRRRGDRLQLGIGLATYVETTGFGAELGGVTRPPGRSSPPASSAWASTRCGWCTPIPPGCRAAAAPWPRAPCRSAAARCCGLASRSSPGAASSPPTCWRRGSRTWSSTRGRVSVWRAHRRRRCRGRRSPRRPPTPLTGRPARTRHRPWPRRSPSRCRAAPTRSARTWPWSRSTRRRAWSGSCGTSPWTTPAGC